jgi:outer membrane protein OmpU
MNNLKKIGLTALASSLVAVSVNAGEMGVSGSFTTTYVTHDGNTVTDANNGGIGIGNNAALSFTGSGELDNGWTFAGNTALTDTNTISSNALSLTMGSMGTLKVGTGHGGASGLYDAQTPAAYEEVDDGGATASSANAIGNFLDNNAIMYTAPTLEFEGTSVTFTAEYSPEANDVSTADGSNSTASTTWGSGKSLGVTLANYGATFGAYAAERTHDGTQTAAVGEGPQAGDASEMVAYLNYAYGPVSVGYSMSHLDSGTNASAVAKASTKVIRTANLFTSETMSIAFNVNDDLSVSYAVLDDKHDAGDDSVTATTKSYQAAYSMGSMSIKGAHTKSDNVGYHEFGGSRTRNEIALGLAF